MLSLTAAIDGWMAKGHKPTPTLVEAAQVLYRTHKVTDISRLDADTKTLNCLATDRITEYKPQTPFEELIVQSMAPSQWLRARALRLQERCFDSESGEIADEKKFALYLRLLQTPTIAPFKTTCSRC